MQNKTIRNTYESVSLYSSSLLLLQLALWNFDPNQKFETKLEIIVRDEVKIRLFLAMKIERKRKQDLFLRICDCTQFNDQYYGVKFREKGIYKQKRFHSTKSMLFHSLRSQLHKTPQDTENRRGRSICGVLSCVLRSWLRAYSNGTHPFVSRDHKSNSSCTTSNTSSTLKIPKDLYQRRVNAEHSSPHPLLHTYCLFGLILTPKTRKPFSKSSKLQPKGRGL